jgi:hypothetical protein
MKPLVVSVFIFLFTNLSIAQAKVEEDITTTLQNAKKGVYWALSNIPVKKAKVEKSIINEDKLIARVKVYRELFGVKIESTGYYQTNELTIVLYKSSDSLLKDGYIKKGELELYTEEE